MAPTMPNPQPQPDAEGRVRDGLAAGFTGAFWTDDYGRKSRGFSADDLRALLASLATLREERESFRGIAEHNSRAVDEWKAERDEMREGWKRDKVAALNAANEVARLTDALTEIANTDYRGNRSHESQLAYRALATRAAHQGTEP